MAVRADLRIWRGDDANVPFLIDTEEVDLSAWQLEYRTQPRQSTPDDEPTFTKATPADIELISETKTATVHIVRADTLDLPSGGYWHTLTRTNGGAHVLLTYGCLEIREP